jgi:hypothetical protein
VVLLFSPVVVWRDAGATATDTPIRSYLPSLASSADGITLAVAPGSSSEFAISRNGGSDWSRTNLNVSVVASSADGVTLTALGGEQMYRSTDSGQTWRQSTITNQGWSTLVSSADGGRLFAIGENNGRRIWTWQSTPQPWLRAQLCNTHIVLSWTVPSTDFILQQTSDLTLTNWTDLPLTPTLNLTSLQYQVTLPLLDGSGFYRLKH